MFIDPSSALYSFKINSGTPAYTNPTKTFSETLNSEPELQTLWCSQIGVPYSEASLNTHLECHSVLKL